MSNINVKEIRIELGYSQEKLAEKLGVSVRTIQNWESGTKIPTSKHAILRNLTISDKNQITPSIKKKDLVTMPREVFEQITNLTQTIMSQQKVIESQQETIKIAISGKNDIAGIV